MPHSHKKATPAVPKAPPSPYVEVTILFRDALKHPIDGLAVQLKTGTGAPPAPAWKIGPDTGGDADPAPEAPTAASAPSGASAPATESAPAPASVPTVPSNSAEGTTDKDGYTTTILNSARNQPIDVLVKNLRGEYVWKATVTPKKDISVFTVISPEYHLEATTKLTPKDEFEQNIDLPVVKDGEVMTIERLVNDFGPYLGWSQKVTEQGRVKKDFPTRKKESVVDDKSKKKKTKITIEHHYKVVDSGKPQTIAFNVLGSRLNYPSPENFSDQQYARMAENLGVEVAAIKAIVMQESEGHPFMENGLPKILYERHHFYGFAVEKQAALLAENEKKEADKKETDEKEVAPKNHKKKKEAKKKKPHIANPYPAYPDLCLPSQGGYGAEGLHQWEKMIRAAKLDFEIALKSCSWGGFQILGEYYPLCDCGNVAEFVNKFISGTDGQTAIFIAFMKNGKPKAVQALRERRWEDVAFQYNGKGWSKSNPHYATNLAKYYDKFK